MCGNCGLNKAVDHRCYIQPYVEKKKKTLQEDTEETLDVLESSPVEGSVNPETKLEPLIVAFNIECAAKEIEGCKDEGFEPVLIGWSYLGIQDDYHESTSITDFLAEMRSHHHQTNRAH